MDNIAYLSITPERTVMILRDGSVWENDVMVEGPTPPEPVREETPWTFWANGEQIG
jgi:hypothetical protein